MPFPVGRKTRISDWKWWCDNKCHQTFFLFPSVFWYPDSSGRASGRLSFLVLTLWVCSLICSQASLEFIKAWRSNWKCHKDDPILVSLSSCCFIIAFLFNFSLLLLLVYFIPFILTFLSNGSGLFSFTRDSSILFVYLDMISCNLSFSSLNLYSASVMHNTFTCI